MKLAEQLYESAPLLPHRISLGLQEELIALHAAGDTLTAVACFSAALWLLRARRATDTGLQPSARRWVVATALLLGCSAVLGIWTLWAPLYYVSGLAKLCAAGTALRAATLLWSSFLRPKAAAAANDSNAEPAPFERRGHALAAQNGLFESLRRLYVTPARVRMAPMLVHGRVVMGTVES